MCIPTCLFSRHMNYAYKILQEDIQGTRNIHVPNSINASHRMTLLYEQKALLELTYTRNFTCRVHLLVQALSFLIMKKQVLSRAHLPRAIYCSSLWYMCTCLCHPAWAGYCWAASNAVKVHYLWCECGWFTLYRSFLKARGSSIAIVSTNKPTPSCKSVKDDVTKLDGMCSYWIDTYLRKQMAKVMFLGIWYSNLISNRCIVCRV